MLVMVLVFAGACSAEDFGWPTPGTTTITQYNRSPHSTRYSYGGNPQGLDIGVPVGTQIFAPAPGTVQSLADLTIYGAKYSFGKYFEIKHDDGTITLYGHLSEFKVTNGQRVNRGDLIALSGNTGNTTGPHLHYEMSGRDIYQYYQTNGYRDPRTMSGSNPRDKVVAYAREILNYTWNASGYVLLYNNNYNPARKSDGSIDFRYSIPYVAKGTIHGIPYTLSSNGGGGAEKTFEQYKALSMNDKLAVSDIYTYSPGSSTFSGLRVSMKYGMSCATFVTDCIRQGLSGAEVGHLTNFHTMSSYSGKITQGERNSSGYSRLQKGDYLMTSGHVMLVVDNGSSSLTVIEQSPPSLGSYWQTLYRITFSNVPGTYTATSCNDGKVGTRERTCTYSSLQSSGYYPMYVNYGGVINEEINPGLRGKSKIIAYTLTTRHYSVYSSSSLTTLLSSTAWTGEDDEDWITSIGNNSSGKAYAQISYPTTSGRRTGYVSLREVFVPGSLTDGARTAKQSYSGLYIRKNSGQNSSYSINSGDSVFLLTKEDGWCQVLCYTASAWRILWLKEADYNALFTTFEITTASFPSAVAGFPFSHQLTASTAVSTWGSAAASVPSNAPTPYRSSLSGSGLTLSSRGLLSGRVAHTTTGKSSLNPLWYHFNAIARTTAGQILTKRLSVSVYEPPSITTGASLPDGSVNTRYSTTINAEGTEFSMEWELKSGTLPPGLSFKGDNSKRTATISGTPTTPGTYRFTIELYNFVGEPETTTRRTFTIVIKGNPNPDPNMYLDYTLKDWRKGEWYSDWIIMRGRSSFNSYAVVDGDLPAGTYLERSGNKIYLRGYPSEAGRYTFKIRIYGNYGYAEKTLTVIITDPSSQDFADSRMSVLWNFANGKVGVTYWDYVYVQGGTSPYTVTVKSGSTPPGLTLFRNGNYVWLSGKPTLDDDYDFTLRIKGEHNGYVDKRFTMKIAANSSYARAFAGEEDDANPTKPKIVTTKLPAVTVRSSYSVQLEASGTKPITWTISGDLPNGLTFNEDGVLSGIAVEAGKYKFKVEASNVKGSVKKSYTLKVLPKKPTILTVELPGGTVNEPYSADIMADGTDIKWTKSGKLPKGLTLNKTTGELSGTPTEAGTYTFKVKAKNNAGKDTVTFTVVIAGEGTAAVKGGTLPAVSAALPERESVSAAELFWDAEDEDWEFEDADADEEDAEAEAEESSGSCSAGTSGAIMLAVLAFLKRK